MTYKIVKTFAFAASHQLDGLPDGHQCGRLHGHNYVVELELRADELDDIGMVYDFGKMKPFRQYLDEAIDHRHLNDVMSVNPTAEALARELYLVAEKRITHAVSAVTVWETPTCKATYRP